MTKSLRFPRLRRILMLLVALAALGLGVLLTQQSARWYQSVPLPVVLPQKLSRPYGMAPVAWQAYLRACNAAKIHPNRIGQTIGDHPNSVGYHKRDGVLPRGKEKIDYTAAVDLGVWDLTPAQINAFVDALAAQGFAAFYRHEGKWKGNEHIHAIYAFLPMKPQLQIQLGEFLSARRKAKKPVQWEKKLRRQNEKLRHWML
jgi:hypothetical protein